LDLLLQPLGSRADPNNEYTGVFIGLLGSFRVLKAGRTVGLRPGGKSEALLGELALRPRLAASRSSLLTALWPDSDTPRAGQSLNSLLYSLRRLLGDGIGGVAPVLHEEGLYRLNTEAGIRVDIVQFDAIAVEAERWASRGNHDSANLLYERALQLYRGDLCLSRDLHAVVEAERLRAMYLRILARMADYAYEANKYASALHYACLLLHHDPCREDAHRIVMRCYARRGERVQALRQYRLCERILKGEFDAPPELTTSRLYELIRLSPDKV
jgi:DNA-binding SARP family transcriptional activator